MKFFTEPEAVASFRDHLVTVDAQKKNARGEILSSYRWSRTETAASER